MRFLIAALAIQVTLALLALAGSIASGLSWRMHAFLLILLVLPPAAAIVQLLREAAIGIPLVALSTILLMSLNDGGAAWRPFVQVFALVLLGLVVWVGRAKGLFTRKRA